MLNSLLAKAFGVERWMFASNILFAFAVLCSIFPVRCGISLARFFYGRYNRISA
jgi:hypothetical protein